MKYRVRERLKMVAFGTLLLGLVGGLFYTVHFALSKDYKHYEKETVEKEVHSKNTIKKEEKEQEEIPEIVEKEIGNSIPDSEINSSINLGKEEIVSNDNNVNNAEILDKIESAIPVIPTDVKDIEEYIDVDEDIEYTSNVNLTCSMNSESEYFTLTETVIASFTYVDLTLLNIDDSYKMVYKDGIDTETISVLDETFDKVVSSFDGLIKQQIKTDTDYTIKYTGTYSSLKLLYSDDFNKEGLFYLNNFKAAYISEGYTCVEE